MKAVVRCLADLDEFAARAAKSGMFAGKPLTVTLVPFHRPASTDQNKKMHSMFRELGAHVGYTEREIKDYFKSEFGPQIRLELPNTEPRMILKGTSDYSVQESEQMIEQLYRVGAEAGCVFSEGK